MKNRLEYIDIAKGIEILCVIIGHDDNKVLSRIVYTFHMPFFCLISGYLLKIRGDTIGFAKKRARRLGLPYIYARGVNR